MPGAILLSYVKDREKEEQLQKLCKHPDRTEEHGKGIG